MTILINRQANSTLLPFASTNATDRKNRAPDKRPWLSVAPKRTSPQTQQRCRTAGTPPALDDQPFGIFERSFGPLAIDPATPRHRQTLPTG